MGGDGANGGGEGKGRRGYGGAFRIRDGIGIKNAYSASASQPLRWSWGNTPQQTPPRASGRVALIEDRAAMAEITHETLFTLGETVPGAAGVLRCAGLDLSRDADLALAEAARRAGVDPVALAERLAQLPCPGEAAPPDTGGLIAHIVARYHETHRRDLSRLIAPAAEVETRHADHPEAPLRVGALIAAMKNAMEDHMWKEEWRAFPMMLQGAAARCTPASCTTSRPSTTTTARICARSNG